MESEDSFPGPKETARSVELIMWEMKKYCLELTLILLMWRIGWAPNSIPIYIQQNATLHSLFRSGNCSTCFGWYFHPSPGAHSTVSTASGICHTVTAICRYRGRAGTRLSVLWVAPQHWIRPWWYLSTLHNVLTDQQVHSTVFSNGW
jgi:hypothetical protein